MLAVGFWMALEGSRMGGGDPDSDADVEMDDGTNDPMDVDQVLAFPDKYVNNEFTVVKHRM